MGKRSFEMFNERSPFSRLRRKFYSRLYQFHATVNRDIPISPGFGAVRIISLEQLQSYRRLVEENISAEKYLSLENRYLEDERKSEFFFFHNPDDEIFGYVEIVLNDFYDSALQTVLQVPPNCAFGVDLYVFPRNRGKRSGVEGLNMMLLEMKQLGRQYALGLIYEDNPASLKNADTFHAVVHGCLYQFRLPGGRLAYRQKIWDKEFLITETAGASSDRVS
ncbi:MAG: GNAT family N-acetyltransferase [Oscillospiraceae bacterium]